MACRRKEFTRQARSEGFKRFDRELSRPWQALFRVRLYNSKFANEG
jgi:hypothetical protein